jgi:cytoskeletal protein CcmA (bactofilin family)
MFWNKPSNPEPPRGDAPADEAALPPLPQAAAALSGDSLGLAVPPALKAESDPQASRDTTDATAPVQLAPTAPTAPTAPMAPLAPPVPPAMHAPVPAADAVRPSVHSAGTRIKGEIVSQGALHIEGEVCGSVQCAELTVGPQGSVEGEIAAQRVHLEGRARGEVACERLEMAGTARMRGVLACKVLVLHGGATLEGEVSVG